MAPIIVLNKVKMQSGVSTTDQDPNFTYTGPLLQSAEELKRVKLEKMMRRASKHRTASRGNIDPVHLNDGSADVSLSRKKSISHKHKHEHKMLGEMLLREEEEKMEESENNRRKEEYSVEKNGSNNENYTSQHTLSQQQSSPNFHSAIHSLDNQEQRPMTHNKTPPTSSSVRKRATYIPNHNGIPAPEFDTENRFKSTYTIGPPHSRNSTVRRGFSGHPTEGIKKVERCAALDDYNLRCLKDMPVIVSEGILRDARCADLFVACGEFPHRDKIPIEEKYQFGKELSRKSDKLKLTQAGGFTYDRGNEELPYEPNNVLDAGYIRKELEWLKDGAFIKGNRDRPRTKGLISEQMTKLTSPTIRSFVPLHMRKEYTENIIDLKREPDLYALPGREKKRGLKHLVEREERASTSPSTPQGFVLQKMPRGRLDTIVSVSQSASSFQGSSVVEGGVVIGDVGGVGKWEGSSYQGSVSGTGVPDGDRNSANLMGGRQQVVQQSVDRARNREKRSGPMIEAVGLKGKRVNAAHVNSNVGIKGERPVSINDTLLKILLIERNQTLVLM